MVKQLEAAGIGVMPANISTSMLNGSSTSKKRAGSNKRQRVEAEVPEVNPVQV